jgi:hypothetical protein
MAQLPLLVKTPTFLTLCKSKVIFIIFFCFRPMKKNCKFCSVEIVTYVEKEVHPLFGLSALFIVFIFGLLSVIILPVLFLLTKNVVHRCSRCLQQLGVKQCYGMPDNFSEPVSKTHVSNIMFKGLALPPRQMRHRDFQDIRYDCTSSFRDRKRLLHILQTYVGFESEPLVSPQYRE